MTLRIPAEDSAALARIDELENRSQHEVVLAALRQYVESVSRKVLIHEVMRRELPRYAEALERLGE